MHCGVSERVYKNSTTSTEFDKGMREGKGTSLSGDWAMQRRNRSAEPGFLFLS